MPFAIDTAQRRFFHENNWIEFEEVFSNKDIARLQQFWAQKSPASYEKGRDWRLEDGRIDRLALPLHEIACELWNERPLYIAFDQVISPGYSLWPQLTKLPLSKTIPSLFSVDFALGCVAVSLSPPPAPIIKKSEEEEPISCSGSVKVFKVGAAITLDQLDPKQTWWIAVYGGDHLRYNPQESDPLKDYFRVKGAATLGKLTQAKIRQVSR